MNNENFIHFIRINLINNINKKSDKIFEVDRQTDLRIHKEKGILIFLNIDSKV